jgi:hypothetical protein
VVSGGASAVPVPALQQQRAGRLQGRGWRGHISIRVQHRRPYEQAMPVSFKDILEAYEFAAVSPHGEHQAYLCRETGKIYLHSDLYEDPEEELPDDLEDDEKYISLPNKYDLNLGKPLVLDFAREILPRDFDTIRNIFSKREAYSKFKELLVRRNALDRWYDCEAKATERALRDWCEGNEIELTD